MQRCKACGCPDHTWLRVKEVARAFDVCPNTVIAWARKGRLKASQLVPRGLVLIDHESVHELLGVRAAD